ncbi:MAG: AAA family ATPase [Rhizobacter sp.]|nr:AAA family ATPase [Ferruginibacter sp.]
MSHIKNIEIKNFKSIRHAKIEDCRRVNVFIGYPNVGKSNILEALGLYSIASFLKGEYFKFDSICRVKHFSELFFNQNYRTEASVSINENFGVNISLESTSTLDLKLGGQNNGKFSNAGDDFIAYKNLYVEQNDMIIKTKSDNIFFPSIESDFRMPNFSVKKYSFLDNSVVNNTKPLSLGIPYGDNLLEVLQRENQLRKDIGEVLQMYKLKLLLDTISGSIMLVKEVDEDSVLRIPYHQIADTLKRLIFYKAAIQSNKDSVLLFEEPEAHMFPPYIAKFTADVNYDENKNQFFIATHSPFVLNDFMEDLDKADLAIYAVGYKRETGETIIKKVSDNDIAEIYQYGIDLFFNLENYLKDAV